MRYPTFSEFLAEGNILNEGHFDSFDELFNFVEQATNNHFTAATHGSGLGAETAGDVLSKADINEIKQKFPRLTYHGEMWRTITIQGNHENITMEQILQHTDNRAGLQSWCRTEAGMDMFMEYHEDVYGTVTDVVIVQQAIGLSIEHIERIAKSMGKKIGLGIEQAAEVQEVLAAYTNPRIERVSVIGDDEDDEYDD